jgi:hypothetical protein
MTSADQRCGSTRPTAGFRRLAGLRAAISGA